MEEMYCRHYITVAENGDIVDGWSGGAWPGRDTGGAVPLTGEGGYQFRLFPDGEENPVLRDDNGVYLYQWVNGTARAKTAGELKAESRGVVIERLRASKLAEAGAECTAAICAGITVGEDRYSLNDHDQVELLAQQGKILAGAAAVPYHADGKPCRMFTAEEFMAVARAAEGHIFFHRTLVNHLNVWIRRAGTVEELEGISYGAELPEDLAESMAAVMEAVGGSVE